VQSDAEFILRNFVFNCQSLLMRFAKKVVLEQFTLFCLINNQYTIVPCISSHHSSRQATMYHIHILQIKGFILAGDQVHGITLKNQISRFRTLKVRPVGGAAVSEKTSQWHGFTTQKKGDNSYTADKT